MEILKKLEKIVSEYKGEEVELTPDTTFDDLGFDSLDKAELLMKLEDDFGIQFPDDIQIGAVKELIEYIEKLSK